MQKILMLVKTLIPYRIELAKLIKAIYYFLLKIKGLFKKP